MLGVDAPEAICTRIDDQAGARVAVDHLVGLGHRRIALIGGDTEDPMRFTPPLYRRDGYLAALAAGGIDYDPLLDELGYFTVAGGEQAMTTILGRAERPDAVFAESDEMAYGAMRAIRRAGLRVPEDIAVIGFDDHESAELLDLSTIRQDVAAQASSLADRLLGVLNGSTDTAVEVLPTELVVRGSTDPARSLRRLTQLPVDASSERVDGRTADGGSAPARSQVSAATASARSTAAVDEASRRGRPAAQANRRRRRRARRAGRTERVPGADGVDQGDLARPLLRGGRLRRYAVAPSGPQ